ncbi:DNA polymerase III subunit beta [Anaplasma bovis]
MGCVVHEGLDFSISRDDLLQSLGYVSGVIERRNNIAVLSCVRMEAKNNVVELTSTDLDVSIEARVNANILSEGVAVASAQLLYDIVRKLSGDSDIRFKMEGGKLLITCGGARFFLHVIEAGKFPTIEAGDLDHTFDIQASCLADLLNKTKFSMSVEESRYNLRGVYLHIDDATLSCVATDGHRLSLARVDKPEGLDSSVGVIIPRKTVNEILKVIGSGSSVGGGDASSSVVRVGLSSSKICFRYRGYFMISRVVDGLFPDYNSVIPNDESVNCVSMDTSVLLGAVDRVSVVVFDKVKAIKLSFSSGKLTLSSASSEQGDATEELSIDYEGSDITIGLNARYLMEVLGCIKGACSIVFSTCDSAVLIKDGEHHGLHLIMPMRT